MNPKNIFKVLWDILNGCIYLVCFILDPIVLCFKYKPLNDAQVFHLQRWLTVLLVADILVIPFTAKIRQEHVFERVTDKEKLVRKRNMS